MTKCFDIGKMSKEKRTIVTMGRKIGGMVLVLILLQLGIPIQAQEINHVELRELVDTPTAGLLSRRSYALDLHLFPQGGVLAKISVGLLSRLSAGISYGGLNIIGEGDLDWNPRLAFQARLRLYDEGFVMPAIAIGFDSQGYGTYEKNKERYQVKSRGAYAVCSKSFWMLGPVGFHAGVNYSLENKDGDNDISIFAGVDKDLLWGCALLAEYDFALNDDSEDGSYGTGNGYLNAGLRWTFAQQLSLEFDLKNIANNRENIPHVSRTVRIIYWNSF